MFKYEYSHIYLNTYRIFGTAVLQQLPGVYYLMKFQFRAISVLLNE